MARCITDKVFRICTGRDPIQDDLERSNCPKAGQVGHSGCGWCPKHELPNFQCGCGMLSAYRAECKQNVENG